MSSTAQNTIQLGFVTLDSIVRSALKDIEASMSRYETFRHYAIEGYREFHFDLAQEIKTKKVTLTPWKAIELPEDFVDLVMLGVVLPSGRVTVFTNDSRIPLPMNNVDTDENGYPDTPTTPQQYPALPDDGNETGQPYYFWNVTPMGEDSGGLFGLTTKSNGIGYWKMNRERQEIQMSPGIAANSEIYMEYISNGMDVTKQNVVNISAEKLIKLYIHWMRLKYGKNTPTIQVREAKDDYYAEWYRVQNRIQRISVEDVLDCARDGYRLISSF